jgi:hypothetical protein
MALLCIYHIVYARLRRVKRTSKNVGAIGRRHHRDAGSALPLFEAMCPAIGIELPAMTSVGLEDGGDRCGLTLPYGRMTHQRRHPVRHDGRNGSRNEHAAREFAAAVVVP